MELDLGWNGHTAASHTKAPQTQSAGVRAPVSHTHTHTHTDTVLGGGGTGAKLLSCPKCFYSHAFLSLSLPLSLSLHLILSICPPGFLFLIHTLLFHSIIHPTFSYVSLCYCSLLGYTHPWRRIQRDRKSTRLNSSHL